MKSVSYIIPNYNGRKLLEKNLPDVIRSMNDQDELVVIDDASSDDSVEWMQSQYLLDKQETNSKEYCQWRNLSFQFENKTIIVQLIMNAQNLRFAASCNRAIRLSSYELLFLLNSDVVPDCDILSYLVPHFDQDDVFAVGCLERDPLENGEVKSGKNVLVFERGMFIHSKAEEFSSGPTAWVSGGSGMFDKSKWDMLHGFDVAFSPAYWEDVDISFRARKNGWKVLFESNALVQHHHESTNSDAFGQKKIQKMSWKNAQYFTWKNSSFAQKLQYLLWKPYWMIKMLG